MRLLIEFAALIKYKITLAVVFTALIAFALGGAAWSPDFFSLLASVFLLSSGAMALNQLQEMHFDALMQRTDDRPLPKGYLKPLPALFIAISAIGAGSLIAFLFLPLPTLLLGLFNILWYNAVYTPLKRVTPLAVMPGSLVGAMPALMGWSAAGGMLYDERIISLSVFLFLWQIPHFWLILQKYNNDYENAGFPGIERLFSAPHIKYVVFSWMLATCFASLLFISSGLISFLAFIWILLAANILLIYLFFNYLKTNKPPQHRWAMASINMYMIVVLLISLADKLLR